MLIATNIATQKSRYPIQPCPAILISLQIGNIYSMVSLPFIFSARDVDTEGNKSDPPKPKTKQSRRWYAYSPPVITHHRTNQNSLGLFSQNYSQSEPKSDPLSSSADSLLSQMLPVADLLIRNSLNNSPGFGKLSADPPHKICVYVACGLAPLINTPE